ncbi:hypothetical protein [Pseudomonas petrae]|uniref:hypothetical protein n=1 Tax=Pseudomonas petrae TaxID=2912190 RepID=UPI001EEFF574|nr:hypothetical protein [Pseudomonas petrae]MCF7535513.1 hypothetical protein [Pseudomonas petrae]MCF7540540.1 hypothetical protein [Pseudomonas petrae]MCF7558854.1 hypothetical protein [Pseudomonas petrae]
MTPDSGLAFEHGWNTVISLDETLCPAIFNQLRNEIDLSIAHKIDRGLESRLGKCTRAAVLEMKEFQDMQWEQLKLDEHQDLALSMLIQHSLGSERYEALFKKDADSATQKGNLYFVNEAKQKLDKLISQHNIILISKNSYSEFLGRDRKNKVPEDRIVAWIPGNVAALTSSDELCPHLALKDYEDGILAPVNNDLTAVENRQGNLYGFPKLHGDTPYLINAGSAGVRVERKGENSPVYVCEIDYK